MTMRRRVLHLFGIFFLIAALPAAGGEGWLTRVEEAREKAQESGQMILVDLYADWCGWCKKLEQSVFSTPEFREFARDFVLLRVDVEDGGEGSELQARYEAMSLPTTLVLGPDMVRVGDVEGYAPTRQYIVAIEREIALFETLVAQYEKLRQSDDLQVLRTLAEEFHGRGDGERAAFIYERLRAKVEPGPGQAWLHFLLADAQRLAEDFSRAEASRERARALAREHGDPDLVERIDLLRFQIAKDRGDCQEARTSLESFLRDHPRSSMARQARRTLDSLRSGETTLCA